MTVLKCKMCNGDIEKNTDGSYTCPYCGTVQTIDFEKSSDYDKIYKSAISTMSAEKYDEAIKLFSEISGYLDSDYLIFVCAKKQTELCYNNALYAMKKSTTEKDYSFAASAFSKIADYADSSKKMYECLERAKKCHKEESYDLGCEFMQKNTIYYLSRAAELFDEADGIYDSEHKKSLCISKRDSLNAELIQKNATMKEKRRKERIIKISIFIIVIVLFIIIGWNK